MHVLGKSGLRVVSLSPCFTLALFHSHIVSLSPCFTLALFHSRLVSLSPCFTLALFQGWGMGSEDLLEQVQLNCSFRNKFIILHPYGHLVDYNTFLKMCFFRSLTGYTDYGRYAVKKDSAYTHTRVNDHIVAGRSVFVHGESPTPRFHPRQSAGIISFLVQGSIIVNSYNAAAEDI
jgi:hypothetical protein